jgi:heat shock protein HslJ
MLSAAGAQTPGGEWKLIEARQNGKNVSFGREIKATLIFGAENRISGSGGCNRYSSRYKTAGRNRISFAPIISTRMACLENDFMRQETTFFALMEKIEKYRIKGNYLTFSDAAKKNVLRFARTDKQKLQAENYSI